MKYLSVLSLVIVLAACNKNKEICTARTADGMAKYEVIGANVCQNQISLENGDYCDCEKK